jgi:hypothetical protein
VAQLKTLQLMTPNNPNFSTHSLPPLIRNYLGDTQKKMEIINFSEFSFSFEYIEELNRLELFIYLFIFPSFVTTLNQNIWI